MGADLNEVTLLENPPLHPHLPSSLCTSGGWQRGYGVKGVRQGTSTWLRWRLPAWFLPGCCFHSFNWRKEGSVASFEALIQTAWWTQAILGGVEAEPWSNKCDVYKWFCEKKQQILNSCLVLAQALWILLIVFIDCHLWQGFSNFWCSQYQFFYYHCISNFKNIIY